MILIHVLERKTDQEYIQLHAICIQAEPFNERHKYHWKLFQNHNSRYGTLDSISLLNELHDLNYKSHKIHVTQFNDFKAATKT